MTASGAQGPYGVFELRRRGPLNLSLLLALLCVLYATLAACIAVAMVLERDAADVFPAALPLSALAVAVLLRVNRRRNAFRRVCITGDGIVCPARWLLGAGARLVPWSELVSIERKTGGLGPRLVLGIAGRLPAAIRGDEFEGITLQSFERKLWHTVSVLPDGGAVLARVCLSRDFMLRQRGPLWATLIGVGILVALFVLQARWVAAGADPLAAALRLGAFSETLVWQGALERLFTAGLLHYDVSHLIMNTALVVAMGYSLENVIGRSLFVLAFLAGSLAAHSATLLLNDVSVALGASGGGFALIGLYAVLVLRCRDHLPTTILFAPGWWLLLVLATLFIPIAGQNDTAHVTGALTGLALGYIVIGCTHPVRWLAPSACLLGAAFAVALALSAITASRWSEIPNEVATAVLHSGDAAAEDLNVALWLLVRDPAAESRLVRDVYHRLNEWPDASPSQSETLAQARRWLDSHPQ